MEGRRDRSRLRVSALLRSLMMGAGAQTTWDPNEKSSDLALSDGFLTVTRTSVVASHPNVLSTSQRNSGKRYFELTRIGTSPVGSNMIAGLCNPSFDPLGGLFPGQPNSVGWLWQVRSIFIEGVEIASPSVPPETSTMASNGDVACFAVDFVNRKLWVRRDGDPDWNGAGIGSENPATNTGGYDISPAIPAGAYIIADIASLVSSGMTLNVGGSAFAGAIPSGFTAWDR